MRNPLAALLLAAAAAAQTSAPANRILVGKVSGARPDGGAVIARLYRLHVAKTGKVRPLRKREFFHRAPDEEALVEDGVFEFTDLRPGHYCVVAFQDADADGALDFDPPEPLGWYASTPGGWIAAVDATAKSREIAVELRSTTPFPARATHPHGELVRTQGIATLRLRGNPKQRGAAHGALVGRQILDFFEFYVLEDKFKSAARYEKTFRPFLNENFRFPAEMLVEVDAVLAGMKKAGTSLRLPWLGRDFDRTDLLAINSYIETRAMRSSCSQFAFWGERTKGTDVKGGLIAGRNMDGEIDVRKTTVQHFLVIAVDQSGDDRKRYLNLMWPGFVGTITGINEEGLYSMENAGPTGPGPVENTLVPVSWIQRFILENVSASVGPGAVERLIDAHRCSGGGSCGPGSVILFAAPFRGQRAPAFVYEGDRFGGAMRLPGEVRPRGRQLIMATNHHLKYGADRDRPGTVFGKPASFSSRWRYEAGMNLVEAWTRGERAVGTKEMVRLLQTVAHGTTEHSIVFRANQMTLDIAVDDLAADMWDAPFQRWRRFRFEDFFVEK